jgi:ribonucleoside-diphosphate reductase alpha chain
MGSEDARLMRERLPSRRGCETFEITVGGLVYRATVARYADGRLAEIFLSNHKYGSATDVAARDSAVLCSLALQHGVTLSTIRHAILRDADGTASGPLGAALDQLQEE